MTSSAVLPELRRACDGQAEPASDTDAVLGVQPEMVVRPGSTEEVSAVLRTCRDHDLAVVVRGTASRLGWGAAPERCDVVLDTTRLDQLVEHASGDLIVVTGAGRLLADLQQDVGAAGQRLGIDPPRSGTVGGAVATGATGPLRLRHGAVRDLVIGMTLVRADGVVAHSGGKVVKNVAGYDLGKLLSGSFGTLAVITQVAFRLHPVPPARHWVTRSVTSAEQAHTAVQALVHSQLVPAAVELTWESTPGAGGTGAGGVVAAEFEGHVDGAGACAEEAVSLLGGDAASALEPPPWWGRDPDPEQPLGLLAQCAVAYELGRLPALLETLAGLVERHGVGVMLRGSAGVGAVQVTLRGDPDGIVGGVGALREAASTFGGSVVVRDAPLEVRTRLDVWGPVNGLQLMRAVKAQFDPSRLLAPGRFVGGI